MDKLFFSLDIWWVVNTVAYNLSNLKLTFMVNKLQVHSHLELIYRLFSHRATCAFFIINNKPITNLVQSLGGKSPSQSDFNQISIRACAPAVPHPPTD